MVGEAKQFDRLAADLRLGARAAKHGVHVGPLPQPGLDRVGARVVLRGEIHLRDEPAVEPAMEGAAKTADHCADADIDGQSQQQRHQREREPGQLLTAVGPGPQRDRALRGALTGAQDDAEHGRQKQRRAEQQPGQNGKARDQAFACEIRQRSDGKRGARETALPGEPALLRHAPGQRLRGHEQRQAHHLDQRLCRSDERTAKAHRKARKQPLRRERQPARDAGAIKPAQACGNVRQQRGRDEIAADNAADACDHGEHQKLHRQRRDEPGCRHTAGAQIAQHRQPLLETEPDRRMDDEESDQKRQQPERRQIEMKARGQALQIGLGAGFNQTQTIAGDILQRRARAGRLGVDQKPRNALRLSQNALREADVGDQHVRRKAGGDVQRRQPLAGLSRDRRTFLQPKLGRSLGRDQRLACGRQKVLQRLLDVRRNNAAARQAQGFDADQIDRPAADADRPFDHGRHQPARAPQLGEQRLRHRHIMGGHQHGIAAERIRRTVVARSRLTVDGLDAAP